MTRLISFLCLFFICFCLQAQLVKVTDRANVKIKKRSKHFQHLHEDFPVDSLQYIATISGEAKNVQTLYTFLRNEAHELKGNFYDMTVFTQKGGKYQIEWKLYFGSDSLTFVNYNLYPKNEIYLFSEFKRGEHYWINNKKIEIPKWSYYKLKLAIDDSVFVNVGSVFKNKNLLKGSESNSPIYLGAIDEVIRLKSFIAPVLVGGLIASMGLAGVFVIYEFQGIKVMQQGDAYFLTQIFKEYIPE